MSRFRPFLVLALAALTLHGCVAEKNARTEADIIQYSDWSQTSLTGKDGTPFFLAETMSSNQTTGGKASMGAVRFLNNCKGLEFRILVEDPGVQFSRKYLSQPSQGEIRIDDLAPMPVTYVYGYNPGDKYLFVDLEKLLSNDTLSQQMRKGQMLRLSVEIEKKTRVFKFTLRNLVPSVQASLSNCQEAAAFSGPAKQAPAKPAGGAGAADDKKFFQ